MLPDMIGNREADKWYTGLGLKYSDCNHALSYAPRGNKNPE